FDVADERFTDPVRVRMRVPGAVAVHDRDEPDPRVGADPLGERLQPGTGVRRLHHLTHIRRVGKGDRHRHGFFGSLPFHTGGGVEIREYRATQHQHGHHGYLHGEQLPGDTPTTAVSTG